MKKQSTVKEIMDKAFLTIESDTTIKDAVAILGRKKLFGACVVDGDGKILGILSEKECLKIYTEAFKAKNPGMLEKTKVGSIMRPDYKAVPSRMSLFDVAQIFLENEFRRMPVVDSGELVGQITRRDIVRAIQAYATGERIED